MAALCMKFCLCCEASSFESEEQLAFSQKPKCFPKLTNVGSKRGIRSREELSLACGSNESRLNWLFVMLAK